MTIAWTTRHRVAQNGDLCAQGQTKVIKVIQEGLGGIRDVLLDGAQAVYCQAYRDVIVPLQRVGSENTFMATAPRYAMETLGMVLIAILVLAMSIRLGDPVAALPILGVLALGAQRCLPLMQQLYSSWSSIIGSKAALFDVLTLLDQPLPAEAIQPEPLPLLLNKYIQLHNVHFRYGDCSPWVLKGVNLLIAKGDRVGFVGTTGSGKSTALDLLMGLLDPTQGRILVDGITISGIHRRAWQRTIAHVPQTIFLLDATVAENIAFGVPASEIDLARVHRSAVQAQISEFIESSPDGYNAIVGERGVRLSGGQRQRIGIARALYKQAEVIIFDEATSALDSETEKAVMQAIEALDMNLTILIIAHRLTTLKNCTQIVELGGGGIVRTGSYHEMLPQTA